MVSLGHIHKVTAVRQAGRRITAGPHADLRGRRSRKSVDKMKGLAYTEQCTYRSGTAPSHLTGLSVGERLVDTRADRALSRLRKTIEAYEISMVRVCSTTRKISAGYSKMLFCKAAASEGSKRTL